MKDDRDMEELDTFLQRLALFVISILIVMAFIMLGGCTALDTQKNAVETISAGVNVKYYYESGEPVQFVKKAKLSEAEKIEVDLALENIERLKVRFNSFEQKPTNLLRDYLLIKSDYMAVEKQYPAIKKIIINHWSEYNEYEKQVFRALDTGIKVLHEKAVRFERGMKTNDMLKTGLQILDTTLKIAAML